MYGLDVSNLIRAVKGNTSWTNWLRIIKAADCGWMYTVDLYVKYRTDSAPTPSVTDHVVLIREGQILDCNAELSGYWYIDHPVTGTIRDSNGNVVITKTKWLKAGTGQETDFFRAVSLSVGVYDIEWSVCGASSSHKLTVSALPSDYVTNDIDVNIVVTDTAGINADAAWDEIKDDVIAKMLVYNATVKFKSAEIKGKYLVIFHLEITGPPAGGIGSIGIGLIASIVILGIIAVIGYLVVTIPSINQVKIAEFAYNTTFHKYTHGECANQTCLEFMACLADKYPDVWDKIKDKFECPKPPPPPPDWKTYITYGAIAITGLAGLYIGIKYILPALKAK